MRFDKATALALLLPSVAARFTEVDTESHILLNPQETENELYHIELAPGITRWVTEEQKWQLRREGQMFMDITDHADLGSFRASTIDSAVFPAKAKLQSEVKPLLSNLSASVMRENLETFSGFHTRYYKSDYGRQSSEWLLNQIRTLITGAGADKYGVNARPFPHAWGQSSNILTIPGKTNATIVIGAHQDSINLWLPSVLAAPGADDDGSGTVTILEALRVLLLSKDVISGKLENTIEFHWYSAEEGGLLGSQDIFQSYEKAGRDVKAMLQQDMTGYVQGTLDAGRPESVGVITDFVSKELTEFIKEIIVEYCEIPFVETKCGYACSDHASASKAGYPSAFVIESSFDASDKHIHTTDDVIKYLSFDHMLQHARMTTAFAYELGFTNFSKLKGSSVDEL